jgi:hypothetical protein
MAMRTMVKRIDRPFPIDGGPSNNCPTTNTTAGAMKRSRGDEIEVIDDGGDNNITIEVHDFWIANGHATLGGRSMSVYGLITF